MEKTPDFDGCIDLLAERLPVRALNEVTSHEPELGFIATMEDITDATVAERLQQEQINTRAIIENAVSGILEVKGTPNEGSLFEWVDPELRDGDNPLVEYVRDLLANHE